MFRLARPPVRRAPFGNPNPSSPQVPKNLEKQFLRHDFWRSQSEKLSFLVSPPQKSRPENCLKARAGPLRSLQKLRTALAFWPVFGQNARSQFHPGILPKTKYPEKPEKPAKTWPKLRSGCDPDQKFARFWSKPGQTWASQIPQPRYPRL